MGIYKPLGGGGMGNVYDVSGLGEEPQFAAGRRLAADEAIPIAFEPARRASAETMTYPTGAP